MNDQVTRLISFTKTKMLNLSTISNKSSLVLVTIVFVGAAYATGYLTGVFGYSAVEQAKAYTLESQKMYTESNSLYDKAQKLACKSHGLIVADCYAGNQKACAMMADSENAFLANFNRTPHEICGFDK